MDVFKMMNKHSHEQVVFCNEPEIGLRAIIAIHDTSLGPSLGGCRFYNYQSDDDAMYDVLRLSRGMTYKASIAGLNLGGGKSVIIGNPETDKNEYLFRAFGRFVDGLGGRYITAEDMNTSVRDMEWVRNETQYVTGISRALGGSGDPSPVTALGVFVGIQAAFKTRRGSEDLNEVKVAVQGVGHVGYHICRLLHEAGAQLFVSDVNQLAVEIIVEEFGATAVNGDEIYGLDVDVFAPCAMGAILNDKTIPQLKAEIIAGAANNQLAESKKHGEALLKRGILYAPDYAINAGGLINVANELEGYNRDRAFQQAEGIYDTLMAIFKTSEAQGIPTNVASDQLAEERIQQVAKIKTFYTSTTHRVFKRS
ncbi:MAG: Glu/Leu/Phe/Val dehydrogenase [Candidatus Marinimicrobia bacterium]|nr:Glu/Leu/Phe/Val dehydrogenase [Candidatus Neomarinimicrobiota bacterium]